MPASQIREARRALQQAFDTLRQVNPEALPPQMQARFARLPGKIAEIEVTLQNILKVIPPR